MLLPLLMNLGMFGSVGTSARPPVGKKRRPFVRVTDKEKLSDFLKSELKRTKPHLEIKDEVVVVKPQVIYRAEKKKEVEFMDNENRKMILLALARFL